MMTWWMAPLVIAERMPRLAGEVADFARGKPASGRRESERMVTEKVIAAQAGFYLGQIEAGALAFEWMMRLATGDLAGLHHLSRTSAPRMMGAMARPAKRALRSNVTRFRRDRKAR